jgi:hypothetical protein
MLGLDGPWKAGGAAELPRLRSPPCGSAGEV